MSQPLPPGWGDGPRWPGPGPTTGVVGAFALLKIAPLFPAELVTTSQLSSLGRIDIQLHRGAREATWDDADELACKLMPTVAYSSHVSIHGATHHTWRGDYPLSLGPVTSIPVTVVWVDPPPSS
jgi:hypothetical protein